MNTFGRTLRDVIILMAIALLFGMKIAARNVSTPTAEARCTELTTIATTETASYEDVRAPVVIRRVIDLTPCTKLSVE